MHCRGTSSTTNTPSYTLIHRVDFDSSAHRIRQRHTLRRHTYSLYLYYSQMYWYRQLPGEGMKQIVFTTTTPPHKYESGFSEDKFPAQKNDPQTGSLTVEKLLPEDSGVYFCAVSQHSDTGD
uniref:Ig-like domain-containing protein n=1 Tax=Dicentrarchus labrax TaxID=13489 RepID=A0A8C4EA71_DICLA